MLQAQGTADSHVALLGKGPGGADPNAYGVPPFAQASDTIHDNGEAGVLASMLEPHT